MVEEKKSELSEREQLIETAKKFEGMLAKVLADTDKKSVIGDEGAKDYKRIDPSQIMAWHTNDEKLAARLVLKDWKSNLVKMPKIDYGGVGTMFPLELLLELLTDAKNYYKEIGVDKRNQYVKLSLVKDKPLKIECEAALLVDASNFAVAFIAPRMEK